MPPLSTVTGDVETEASLELSSRSNSLLHADRFLGTPGVSHVDRVIAIGVLDSTQDAPFIYLITSFPHVLNQAYLIYESLLKTGPFFQILSIGPTS